MNGRIFLDYLRERPHGDGRSPALEGAPPGATVSMPSPGRRSKPISTLRASPFAQCQRCWPRARAGRITATVYVRSSTAIKQLSKVTSCGLTSRVRYACPGSSRRPLQRCIPKQLLLLLAVRPQYQPNGWRAPTHQFGCHRSGSSPDCANAGTLATPQSFKFEALFPRTSSR